MGVMITRPAPTQTLCRAPTDQITFGQIQRNPYPNGDIVQFTANISCDADTDDSGTYIIKSCPTPGVIQSTCISMQNGPNDIKMLLDPENKFIHDATGPYCWCRMMTLGNLNYTQTQGQWLGGGPMYTYSAAAGVIACLQVCITKCIDYYKNTKLEINKDLLMNAS